MIISPELDEVKEFIIYKYSFVKLQNLNFELIIVIKIKFFIKQ